MYKLVTFAALIAVASAGVIGVPAAVYSLGHAPAVATYHAAPIAVAHAPVASSIQNQVHLVHNSVPVVRTVAAHAPAVAVAHAPAIAVAHAPAVAVAHAPIAVALSHGAVSYHR